MNLIYAYPRASSIPQVGVCINTLRGYNPAFPVSDDQQLAMVREVGAKIIRWNLPWAEIETSPGVYNWGAYYSRFQLFKNAGVKSLIILGLGNPLYTASWASPPTTAAAIKAFSDFAVAALKQFGAASAFYEITNEPNMPISWGGAPDPAQYGALLSAVSVAMKNVRSDAVVISGGLGVNDPDNFIKAALSIVDKSKLTGIGYHPYTGGDAYYSDPLMRPESVIDRFRACRQLVGAGCPVIYNTEQGYYLTTCGGDTLEAKLKRQAGFAARFVLNALYLGCPFSIWYNLVDDGTDMSDMEQGLGLFDFNFNIKPAGTAFKSMTALLNNCLSASTYKDGDLYQVVFNMADGPRSIVWSANGQLSRPLPVDEKQLPLVLNGLSL